MKIFELIAILDYTEIYKPRESNPIANNNLFITEMPMVGGASTIKGNSASAKNDNRKMQSSKSGFPALSSTKNFNSTAQLLKN